MGKAPLIPQGAHGDKPREDSYVQASQRGAKA
ncbi:hypothetical protein RHAL1_03099 [Beijerinckiaceae bacterium RH AL1]|nr:hypothetical protein RHCH11_RHCH11_03036 [Beijerinckiaceae bacterium RH CH11]VVB48080.1 hypothetical protein RHAL8_03032 [Beijerinckiaceae bacterium RH AL8]VVC56173.1 hypothetical protein RHAL1_03099 [Beijerinckiaceae bacterium RH AL1]